MSNFSKCKICGKIFEQKGSGRPRKYCSTLCQSKRDRFRSKVKYTCLYCGEIFYSRKRKCKVSFCSPQCSVEAKCYKKEDMKQHVCQICGKEFYKLPGNSNPNMYCSKRCQLISVGSKSRPYTEEVFETLLRNNGIKYETQYKYTKYFADFYIPLFNLLFELDGRTFHSSDTVIEKDKVKGKVSLECGFNMIRVWCSRKNQVEKLNNMVKKLRGDDLAEVISAIPEGMINSVNLLKGCGDAFTANGENQITGNAVSSLEENFFEDVETKGEPKE